jgi:hypothetical protein
LLVCLGLLWLCPAGAGAQERVEEQPDPTRLDVERLPPEAIEITRDLYSHGVFLETHIGARGFVGGVGRLSAPGPYLSVGFGYEVTRWLWIKGTMEASLHRTDAPAPPAPTVFELFGFLGEVRFQADFSARVAGWLGGEVGMVLTTTDVLSTYGLQSAARVGLVYGGQLGLDWHMRNRHHSLGLAGGARMYPSLDGPDGELAVGVHGTAYLRYVF